MSTRILIYGSQFHFILSLLGGLWERVAAFLTITRKLMIQIRIYIIYLSLELDFDCNFSSSLYLDGVLERRIYLRMETLKNRTQGCGSVLTLLHHWRRILSLGVRVFRKFITMSNVVGAEFFAGASDASFINSGGAAYADFLSEADSWLTDKIDNKGKSVVQLHYASINANQPSTDINWPMQSQNSWLEQLAYKWLNINWPMQNSWLEQLAFKWLSRNWPIPLCQIRRGFSLMGMNYVREQINAFGGGRRAIARLLGNAFIPGTFAGSEPQLVACCVDILVGRIGLSEAADEILDSMDALINQGIPNSALCPSTSQYHSSSSIYAGHNIFIPTYEVAETSNFIHLTKAARNHRYNHLSKLKQISRMKMAATASTSKREPKRVPSRQKIQHSTSPIMIDNSNKSLTFLLQKELKNSDVSSLGRIVLPKKAAEANLPVLYDKQGVIIDMEDFATSNMWHLRYRFWPNNKTRMYVLENTKEFVKLHGLEAGDYVMLYRDEEGRNVIRAAKVPKAAPKREGEDGHDHAANQNGNNDTAVSVSVTDNTIHIHIDAIDNIITFDDDDDDFLKELWVDTADASSDILNQVMSTDDDIDIFKDLDLDAGDMSLENLNFLEEQGLFV